MKKFTLGLMMVVALLASCSSDNKGSDDDAVKGTGVATTTKYLRCVEQVIDGCNDIANEVGNAKIGDPYDLYVNGNVEDALYAVESWYSWHSIDDYSNNILSIRNAYYGSRDGSVSSKSISALVKKIDAVLVSKGKASDFDKEMKDAINKAYTSIQAIPAPFRNNINSAEARQATVACNELDETLRDLKAVIQNSGDICTEASLKEVVENYVNEVVLPTYADLKKENTALNTAVRALAAEMPSGDNAAEDFANMDAAKIAKINDLFEKACDAWLEAREPWETSEAFLFGPVDALGLDPNMDSWPLDQKQIMTILTSGKFDKLNWADGDSDDEIEASQGVRGFHTLEFLIFRDGKARTLSDVKDETSSRDVVITASNCASWANYMVQVASLLQQDATSLDNAWNVSYENGSSYASKFSAADF